MKNIHILPTDKPSRLKQNNITKKISLVNKGIDLTAYTPINIYITSPNEDINENDYIITKDGRLVQVSYLLSKDIYSASKVTLATDVDLIKDGVQDIDDEFLEWFVKNPSCEEVEVEDYGNLYNFRYLILIPKEESKQETPTVNGSYGCTIPIKEPKQETLEEAGLEHCNMLDEFPALVNPLFSFKQGAKWQQERSYSEEEVYSIIRMCLGMKESGKTDIEIGTCLERYRKK